MLRSHPRELGRTGEAAPLTGSGFSCAPGGPDGRRTKHGTDRSRSRRRSRGPSRRGAFAGAEKLLLVSSSEVGQRLPQHRSAIAAAKDAGVGLIAYTSILRADTSGLALAREHVETVLDVVLTAAAPHEPTPEPDR